MTRKSIAAPLLIAVMVTAFFWKLLTKQYTWMDHPDMASQILPWLQFQAAQWHAWHWFPLWDPNVWGGQPLVGQVVPGSTYPFHWILFLLPFGSDGRILPLFLHLQFIVSHILAAIFCYWLCRDMGRSRHASILAGLAFSLTGMVGSWGWPQMLNSSIWMPIAAMFFRRSIVDESKRRVPHAAVAGFFTGLMFLGGHHQIPMLFAFLIGGMWLVRFWKQPLREVLAPSAAFAVLCGLTAGFQLLPALEYGSRSIRWVGSQNPVGWGQSVPYSVHQDFQHSFFPSNLLGLVLPSVSEYAAFVGVVVIVLAMTGIAAGFRRFAEVQYIVAIGVAGCLFAFGGFSVFHGQAYLFLPMVEKARSPQMAFCLAQFAIVVLSAFGLDAIRENPQTFPRRWITVLTGLGAIAWIAVAIAASVRPQAGLEYERAVIFGLMAFTFAAWMTGWRAGAIAPQTMMTAVLLAVYFEAGTFTGRDFQHRESAPGHSNEHTKHQDLVTYLKSQPGPVRVQYDPASSIRYNMGDWDGVPQFHAFLAGLTANVARLEGAEQLKALVPKIFALTHYAGMEPNRPDAQEEVFRAKSGVRLFRNTDAFPRTWIVHEAQEVSEPNLVSTLATTDLGRRAIVTGQAAPALTACAESMGIETVSYTRYETDDVEASATLACKGMVVLSETWYPGWSARVDGAAASLYEVDGAIRGVVVDKGSHRIEMHYRPFSVYAGAAMSCAGFLGGFCSLWLTKRRRATDNN